MIGRGLILLTILSNCVLSLPVTPSQLENEDVEVMKCIVEALADVLSRPHHMPVSQECLVTLKTDDRLVTILRHHNFLKELQEIAVQGGQERVEPQRDADVPTPTTPTLQTADEDVADRSMLEALGGPGERSILNQRKRMGKEKKDESMEDDESKEEEVVKRENDGSISEPLEEWSEGEKREEEEEYEEKRRHSDKEDDTGDDEKRNAPTNKSKERTSDEEDEEEKDKRSALVSHKHKAKEQDEVMKRGSSEGLKQWTKRDKSLKKKGVKKDAQQHEIPHHSKEVLEEAEEEKKKKKKKDKQKSPELKELQMIAQRTPEERRVLEEEGSASRKSEEPEIESLAAIESELENVAQKLHELRRG